ncbi:folate family ECF transporter S component [Halothermothrix orenii]|uniref:Signal transduction histidine kinase, LytS n=1 Tax=Halothermothrix orenii (strain H 168 / OCM 544 / DSM 9562) TaxID=373903 RepID=B8D068_HALOH|nr:folate family ECF transporter S component [Halothermothrix orenii]ACL68822.1 signal transduction histidine kinase, LytS [Halothermothrix orenii H 168]
MISTRKIVYLAFLTAISIVLTRFLSIRLPMAGVESIRIGFGGLPIILAGVAFGPLAGGLVGFISDLVGYFINPMGAYMPHFTLTSALTGIIPGLVVFYLFRQKRTFWTLLVAIGIGQGITSVVLVPYFLQSLFLVPIKATIIPRMIGQLIHIPLYTYLSMVLINNKAINLTKD